MEKERRSFFSLFDKVLDVCATFGQIVLLLQAMSVTLDVILRFLFGKTLPGVIAWNEWSLLVITFLGIAWLQRDHGHVNMDIFTEKLPEDKKIVFDIFAYIMAIFVSIVLIWFGTVVVWNQWVIGAYDFFKLNYIPLYYITVAIPIGSILLLIQVLRELYASIGKLIEIRKADNSAAPCENLIVNQKEEV